MTKLSEQVATLETKCELLGEEVARVRRTLWVNFGPQGRSIPNLLTEANTNDTTETMMFNVIEHLIRNQR